MRLVHFLRCSKGAVLTETLVAGVIFLLIGFIALDYLTHRTHGNHQIILTEPANPRLIDPD